MFHDTIKSGEQIGTYRLAGNKVEIEMMHKGKANKKTFALDNVGLLFPRGFPFRYYALNSKSSKTDIHAAIERIRSWN